MFKKDTADRKFFRQSLHVLGCLISIARISGGQEPLKKWGETEKPNE
jgi:hypothetical protein